jgi:DNA-binding NtrC family response regulator
MLSLMGYDSTAMKNGHPLNNGENHNHFPLVRKPSSAVEKAAPGARRILSGMVADALALAKNKERKKLRIVVLDDEEGPRRSCVVCLKGCWPHGEEILEFDDSLDAWQELSRTDPDLFITDIQHVGISCKEMLTRLAERKVKYPVLVISAVLGVYEDSGEPIWVQDVKRDWKPNLNVTFLSKPYTLKKFRTAFETALKIPRDTAMPALTNKARPIKIVMVNDEPVLLELFSDLIRGWFKDVTILFFGNGATALEELLQRDPDLLITDDRMPRMNGQELCQCLHHRWVAYPIIMVCALPQTERWCREFANQRLDISFLPMPFDLENFRKLLETALKIPRDTPTQNEIIPLKSRPLNRRGKLLIVDDEEWLREMLEVIFKDDYDLFMAGGGLTAIELAKQHHIDVALTNLNMGRMDGFQLLERLKILKPDIEVIMMTGWVDTGETRLEALRLGACDFINKPFDAATIRAAVSKAMQRRTLESEITAARETPSSNVEKIADQPLQTRPLKIVVIDENPYPLELMELAIKKSFKNVILQTFQFKGEGLQELTRLNPDLLIVEIVNDGRLDFEILQSLADKKVTYPIIVTSGLEEPRLTVNSYATKGLKISFLPKPFPEETFIEILEANLKIPRAIARSDAEIAPVVADTDLENWFQTGEKYYYKGLPHNYAEAVKWFRMAAERGHAQAQWHLGVCHADGLGVAQDEAEAVKWYLMAAEQGLAEAQNDLGVCYHNGQGVPRDYAEAAKWYRKAAEQGNNAAQSNLGNFPLP